MKRVVARFSFAPPRLAVGRFGSSGPLRSHHTNKRRPLVQFGPTSSKAAARLFCSEHNGVPVVEFDKQTVARDDYDAICVLGGGYFANGTLPPWVLRRLDLACSLFERQTGPCVVLCVGGGTPHRPPIQDADGYTVHEATLLAAHLLSQGLEAQHVLKEFSSYDTVGNAYFTLTSHAIPAQWSRMAVVTSDFHMPRSQALYNDIFDLGRDCLVEPFLMEFFAVSDEGALSPTALEARRSREATSLATWKQNLSRLESLADFHRWLYATHQCYAVARQHEFTFSNLNNLERKSY